MILLFFSDIPWEHLHQRPQQLATRLAEQWRVLWIEPATLGALRKWTPVRHREGLHLLTIPQLPYNARNSMIRTAARVLGSVPGFRRLLTALQLRLLQRALRHLGFEHETVAALVENFQFAPLIERIRPKAVLFDYIDDAFGFTDYPAHVHREWQQTVRMASAVTVTSAALMSQIERERPIRAHLVENGVNVSLYRSDAHHPRPEDMPAQDRLVIIYVGTIAQWFDFALLAEALRAYPQYVFVLVGPAHPGVRQNVAEIGAFANCHVLGQRPHQAIPAYLRVSTVGLIPFIRNRLTNAVNPVKLYEYAAAGLPVVTTAFADDLDRFRDIAFIGRTHEEFLSWIPTALAAARDTRHVARLRAFAADHDWSTRSAALLSLLAQHTQDTTNSQTTS